MSRKGVDPPRDQIVLRAPLRLDQVRESLSSEGGCQGGPICPRQPRSAKALIVLDRTFPAVIIAHLRITSPAMISISPARETNRLSPEVCQQRKNVAKKSQEGERARPHVTSDAPVPSPKAR